MKRWIAPLLAVLGLPTLAACGGGDDAPPPTAYCPQPAVLQQGNTVTLFLPGHQDVASEVAVAKISGIAGSCTLTDKGLLRVRFQTGFTATNGPANNSTKLTLPYFIAISNGDMIISKVAYSIALSFDGNISTSSATSKPVTVELSNVPDSANTQILVSFQMTQDQLAYAAAHPGGT